MLKIFEILPKSRRMKMAKKTIVKKVDDKSGEKIVDAKHSVPMAGDREAPAIVKKHSKVVDRFRGKAKPSTKEVKDSTRPVIDIDDETKQKFVDFAATRELFQIFEESQKEQTGDVYRAIFDKYKLALWNSKSQPKNPSIKVNDPSGRLEAEGQFIVTVGSKIKINMPEVPEDKLPEEVMLESLVLLGVKKAYAEALIEKEVSFVPQWSLNFTDMLHGTFAKGKFNPANDSQISASEVLFQVINGQDEDGEGLSPKAKLDMLKGITEEGWILLKQNIESHTKYFPQLVDGENFLDRVCNYADNFEELLAILTVFSPVHYCARVKFACSDTPENKTKRLIAEATSALTRESDDEKIERAYKE